MDEADQFDDWIELYNPEDRWVKLDGLNLSDDPANPKRWRVPNVSIPPLGHMLVWCDDDTDQGRLHTPFKLDAGGEEIALYDFDARENGVLDRIAFGPQESDVALGRSPDGSDNIILLPVATPGKPNP